MVNDPLQLLGMIDKRIKSWYYILFVSAFIWLSTYKHGTYELFLIYSSVVCCMLIFSNIFFVHFSLLYPKYTLWNIAINLIWLLNVGLLNTYLALGFGLLILLLTSVNLTYTKNGSSEEMQSPFIFAFRHTNLFSTIATVLGVTMLTLALFLS